MKPAVVRVLVVTVEMEMAMLVVVEVATLAMLATLVTVGAASAWQEEARLAALNKEAVEAAPWEEAVMVLATMAKVTTGWEPLVAVDRARVVEAVSVAGMQVTEVRAVAE